MEQSALLQESVCFSIEQCLSWLQCICWRPAFCSWAYHSLPSPLTPWLYRLSPQCDSRGLSGDLVSRMCSMTLSMKTILHYMTCIYYPRIPPPLFPLLTKLSRLTRPHLVKVRGNTAATEPTPRPGGFDGVEEIPRSRLEEAENGLPRAR